MVDDSYEVLCKMAHDDGFTKKKYTGALARGMIELAIHCLKKLTEKETTIQASGLSISNSPKVLLAKDVSVPGEYLWLPRCCINEEDIENQWIAVTCVFAQNGSRISDRVEHPFGNGIYYGPIIPPKIDIEKIQNEV